MNEIKKSFSGEPMKADARKDIDLINKYTLRELKPEEVFAFNVNLCDTQTDRDYEAFDIDGLNKLARLFPGKPLIQDHAHSASNQQGRVYRCQVIQDNGIARLRASIYMIRTPKTEETIAQIEGGILKEVSIGFSIKRLTCSICGAEMKRSWFSPTVCKNDHEKGKIYDSKTCIGIMEDPTDAYEVSFVAVPSQREAGVTKGRITAADMTPEEQEARKRIRESAVNTITSLSSDKGTQARKTGNSPGTHEGPGTIPFAIIPDSSVNSLLKKECTIALAFAREELGLPRIDIKYFVPLSSLKQPGFTVNKSDIFQNDSNCAGTIDTKTVERIYIRADYSNSFAKTVLHECFHVMQNRTSSVTGISHSLGEIEASAYQYADAALARYRNLSPEEKQALYEKELFDFE